MDDNSLKKLTPQGNTKPTFLSSENPDVLKNFDISTTPVQQKPSPTSELYSSPYSEPQNQNTPNQLQQSFPPQIQNQSQDTFAAQSRLPQQFPPVQTSEQNTQETNPIVYRQAPLTSPVSSTIVDPLKSETKVVYKEKKGSGFLGNLFSQIFNCSGCFLFFLVILIGLFVYILNF